MTRSGLFTLLLGALSSLGPLEALCDTIGAPILWRNLTNVQSAIGATNCLWDGDSLCFSNGEHLIRFFAGRRKSDIDGTAVWLNATPDGSVPAGDWRMASSDLDLLVLSVLPQDESVTKKLLVMLDPGHGGEDDGASCSSPSVKEKDLSLAIALRIGASLTNAGFQVAYTRTNDTDLALDERSRLARLARADLFVSIHANYAANAEAAGVETYVLPLTGFPGTAEGSGVRSRQTGNRNDFQNTLLGYSIHRFMARADASADRGLKRQSFYVLRETRCPAALLEIGFLSNPADVQRMLSDGWQNACAAAVTDGVLAYAKRIDRLDRALAERRARDAEANERWKRRLAAQAQATRDNQTPVSSNNLTAAVQPGRPPLGVAAASSNEPTAALTSLIQFYATGTPE